MEIATGYISHNESPLLEGKGYKSHDIRRILKTEGQNPFDYITKQIENGVKIIGIGELHEEAPVLEAGYNLINHIVDNTIKPVGVIALELSHNFQHIVDEYMANPNQVSASDKLSQKVREYIHTGGEVTPEVIYLTSVIRLAKSRGIDVACIDGIESDRRLRDENMQKNLKELNDKNPGKLIIAALGNIHISSMYIKEGSRTSENVGGAPYPKLADMLDRREYLSIGFDLIPFAKKVSKVGTLVATGEEMNKRLNKTRSITGDYYGSNRAIVIIPSLHPKVFIGGVIQSLAR